MGWQIKSYSGLLVQFQKLKACLLFVKNLSKVIAKSQAIRVLLVGDGNAVTELKEIVKAENLGEYVIFTGRVDHDQILKYYSLIDIFL